MGVGSGSIHSVGFLVLFRRERGRNPFRAFLQSLLEWQTCDELVLASGYVWESAAPNGYRVSDDDVAACLTRGSHRRVVTIGGMHKKIGGWFGADYRQHYLDFVKALRANGIPIEPKVSKSGRWHAKVAIGLQGGTPVAGIVGSSNLTGPAYGIDRRNFNNEADVVLWTTPEARSRFLSVLGDLDLPPEDFIVGSVDPEFRQPTEQQRLDAVLADLLNPDGVEPLVE